MGPPCSFYLDLDWLGQYWNCWEGKSRIYHHTGPVNTMYGLREGLAMVAEEGLENCWRRHRLAADTLQSGLAELGLEMFGRDLRRTRTQRWKGLEDRSDGKQRQHRSCFQGTGSPERRTSSSGLEGSRLKTDGGEGTKQQQTVTEHHITSQMDLHHRVMQSAVTEHHKPTTDIR